MQAIDTPVDLIIINLIKPKFQTPRKRNIHETSRIYKRGKEKEKETSKVITNQSDLDKDARRDLDPNELFMR